MSRVDMYCNLLLARDSENLVSSSLIIDIPQKPIRLEDMEEERLMAAIPIADRHQ